MSLSNVRKTVFNPLLQTKEEISEYLQSLSDGNNIAHPFNKTLLVREKNKIHEIDISDKPESFFFSATDLNSLSETITNRIELFTTDLDKFKEYNIISLTTSYLEVPFVSGEKAIIALSKRQPTYYDLCLGDVDGNIICYSSTSSTRHPGITHSGDRNHGDTLLHFLTVGDNMANKPFALFVSGYQYTQLSRYQPQNPAVMICDHPSKLMYVIPVPLDAVTIGEATLCAPVVGRRRGDKLCFSVLPSAVTSNQMASGSSLPGDTMARAIAREILPTSPVSSTSGPAGTSSQKPKAKKAKVVEVPTMKLEAEVDVDIRKPLIITEEGCSLPAFIKEQDGNHISFFQGISVHAKQPEDIKMEDSSVVFPCALGNTLEGPMILALGKSMVGAKVTSEQYRKLFDKSSVIVFTVSDKMTDQARVLNPDLRCNALYIVQPHEDLTSKGNQTGGVEDMLNDIKINAITALAGPQSIVVVQLGERYYLHRGIRWEGVFVDVPKFGEDVTEAIEDILKVQDMQKRPWNNIISLTANPEVYFRGKPCTADDLYTNFTSLTLEELESFKPEILDTLVQLQVVMSPKDLPALTSRLQVALKKMMDDSFADAKKEYLDKLMASGGKERDPRLLEKYRRGEKQAKVAVQWLIDALAALVSSRISSTRRNDLKQMIRKSKIQDNVAASKEMTYEGLGELLEEHCSEIGMVIANIEETAFRKLMSELSNGKLLTHLQEQAGKTPPRICTLDDRVLHLTGLDSGIIIPLSQEYHNGPLSIPKGQVAMAIPRGLSKGENGSAFAFACFDQFINIKHPFSQHWFELCNEAHISVLRILQRNTMCNAIPMREYHVAPSNKDLGFLLAYSITDIMKSLAATRSAPPPPSDDGDTTTKVMRGLYGYLMTVLAAGTQPMSMGWQMLSKSDAIEVPTSDTFWLYTTIIQLFPYTAWPQEQFKKNVRLLVAKLVRKQVTDPVTKSLRENVSQMEQNKVKEFAIKRNKELRWGEVILEVLKTLLSGIYDDKDNVKQIAERALSIVPTEEVSKKKGKRGLYRAIRALRKLKDSGDLSLLDKDSRLSAANTYAKRSAAFKEEKSKLLAAGLEHPDEAEARLNELVESRKALAEKFGVEKVHMQNKKHLNKFASLIEDVKSGKVDRKAVIVLKGDAELYREAWVVGKPEEQEEPSKKHLIQFVLTGDMPPADVATQPTEVAEKPPQALSDKLSALPGGDKAGKMVKVVEKISALKGFCQLAKLPEADFEYMLNYGRSNQENEVDTLKKVAMIYLENWSDVNDAQERVMAFLKG